MRRERMTMSTIGTRKLCVDMIKSAQTFSVADTGSITTRVAPCSSLLTPWYRVVPALDEKNYLVAIIITR